ncbi:hypothetical protein PMKS-002808 [Pichia membranifaciens]|uniref:Patatin-like phospholipase domain-containing protein n=1 Tax=Pichia membranifaciens TaxID=4926 RepID=A0A1Q2YIE7_9ASCO|nr:hypothetical protein PMKS-002808 [Pichia membranifaciens]
MVTGSSSDPMESVIEELHHTQAEALTYEDWLDASLRLDVLEGNDSWKDVTESDLYDYEAVATQLSKLREFRANKDYYQILYAVRTCWKRDFAGINNELLYKKSHVGTKTLISEYIEECVKCLESLVSEDCPINDEYILEVLLESKRNYGRGAITMSGGGTFGLIGIGVFSTLLERDLFPKIVSGSSCGSIVSAFMCAKTSDEIKQISWSLFDATFEVFNVETDRDTFYTHLSRLLKYGVWFDSKYLQQTMKGFLGNITFREAYNKTGRILNITVSSATIHDQPTLLNYLTAPNVLIWSAVCASCSLPIVFASSTIFEKNVETGEINEWSNPLLKFVDGSLNSDLPISRLSEMFNVNHTIACQVNPHIAPIVKFSSECHELGSNGVIWDLKLMVFKLSSIFSLELSHYCDILNELGIMSNLATKLKQMITQSYSGDITILPELKMGDQSKTLVNPTPTFIWKCILKGARATWPKLSMIKDQYTVEFAMDKYISVLRSRVVFESNSNRRMPKEASISCESSPQKSNKPIGIPKSQPVSFEAKNRRRGESINVSEKLRANENISPFSSRVNLYGKQRAPKPKKSYKFEVSMSKHREASALQPDHSFESLRNIQKRPSYDGSLFSHAKKKHTRSLSYTLAPENLAIDTSCGEELILPMVNTQNRRASASSGVAMEMDEPSYSALSTGGLRENNVLLYPEEVLQIKNKRE